MWFDALGRHSWGQIRTSGPTTTVLNVSPAAFTITGVAVSFQIKEAVAPAAFAITGVAVSFKLTEAVSPTSLAITFQNAPLQIKIVPSPGAFIITGGVVVDLLTEQVTPAAFTITAYPVGLSRTGFDYDVQQGGIGHYKLDLERARQLAKITRKVPPPIDLRTAPTFKSVGSPPIAPALPAPDVTAMPNQRAGEAAAKAARQKRDIEAILLLAS